MPKRTVAATLFAVSLSLTWAVTGSAQAISLDAANSDEVVAAAHRLDDAGRAHKFAAAAEVRIDGALNVVDVFTSDISEENAASIQALAQIPKGNIRIHLVGRTEDELNIVMKRVVDLYDELALRGIPVNSVRRDVERGVVAVGVDNPEAATATLAALFGKDVVAEKQEAAETASGRLADSSPWYAGDFLNVGSEDCSSGVNIHDSRPVYYIMTAGHCFPGGTTVVNGSSVIGRYNQTIGPISSIAPISTSHLDAELIRPSSGINGVYSFTGGNNDTAVAYSYTYVYRPLVGDHICTDGAFEYLHCNAEVFQNDYCITTNYGLSCHITRAQKLGEQIVGNGDSGGPVFISPIPSYGAALAGIITAQPNSSAVTCTRYATATRKCSDTVYITEIGPLLSYFNALITS